MHLRAGHYAEGVRAEGAEDGLQGDGAGGTGAGRAQGGAPVMKQSQTGGNMERTLQKCRVCGEWFNTTDAIMVEHFQSKHQRHLEKAFVIAKLVITREMYLAKAKYEPWPQSQQFALAAQMAHDQLQLVIQTPC